jgi:hypothetical protein
MGVGSIGRADAVAIDVLEGRKESSVMPLAETLRIMRATDTVRKANGLVLDNTGFSCTGFTSATPKSALQAFIFIIST